MDSRLSCEGGDMISGGGDGIIFRKGDTDVEIAVLTVTNALVEVGHFVPALAVIDGGLGIPLGDLVDTIIVPAAGEEEGQLFVEGRSDRYLGAR